MDNNFAGMNGFIWWVGVVENRYDPLKLGRLRVRIVGWHNEDKNELQSEHLPWAISIEEFRKSGDFKDWNDEAVQQAIGTLAELTIIAFNLSHHKPEIKNNEK